MKKIVIIGANDFQNQLILKAKEMGHETHVFAWKEGAVGEKTADYFYPISITEKEEILNKCRNINPDGIVSIASDLAVDTVTYVASNLGLVCNSVDSVLCCTNKYEMRRKLKNSGIPTPGFMVVNSKVRKEDITLSYPIIVKPTDRSGSRGVTKVTEYKYLNPAIEKAIENSFEKRAIIEEFIEGNEYSCECISFKGNHSFLSLTKKYTTGEPHFIETGHIQPSDISVENEEEIVSMIYLALDALGIRNGASHSEFRVNKDGKVGIIEIGARMGGDCIGSDLVKISTGYDFLKMTIDVAMGEKPVMKRVSSPRIGIVQFIFGKDDIARMERILEKAPEAVYRVSDIESENFKRVVDSSTRLGYYILSCSSMQEANQLLGL